MSMKSIFTATLLLLSPYLSAEESSFLKRSQEGWFWYREVEPPEPPEEQKEADKPVSPPTPPPIAIPQGPPALSTAWLRENMQKYLDNAQDNPSEENVQAYLLLQNLALKKSLIFSDVAQSSVTGHPVLDSNNDRPISTFGGNAMDFQADAARRKLLAQISANAGLFIFFDATPISMAYLKIVDGTRSGYNFSTKYISIDNAPKDNHTNFIPDAGHAQLMGITTFPSTVLVSPDGSFSVVARSALSQQELEQRILITARKMKIISYEDFDSTRSFKNFPGNNAQQKGTSDLPLQPHEIINSIGVPHDLHN